MTRCYDEDDGVHLTAEQAKVVARVLGFVSRGRTARHARPYPDASARRALAFFDPALVEEACADLPTVGVLHPEITVYGPVTP